MDLEISERLNGLQQRVRRFIAEEIIPLERDPRQTSHGPTEEFRHEPVVKARSAGLLSPHVSEEFGGLGLNHREKAVIFGEELAVSPSVSLSASP